MEKKIQKDNKTNTEITPDTNCQVTEETIQRCFNMLNYISNSAADIITDVIHKNPCHEAKQFLRDWPEEIAVRAYRKVLEELNVMKQNHLSNNFH
jgi:hypothetical protein